MSPEQLGQIDKPSASQYMGKKILFLVPLLQQLASMPPDGEAILKGYWTQVDDQIDSLETGLGPVTRIYHEYIIFCYNWNIKS